ncbi:acyloxyacyl hydrolase [Pontivivens ytuae]|uniref:Acyloxyacyl hydrolase n=1 Tax=Pontivivens ytuae TaxID=2789856 RepID=A0A7S9LVH0_9RHOB|nr:acyloxyacyl hydrolase [Pontivivens ytuae]QPH55918.1 acyloxyacyl hydrolase [Pontivivens ytuae]
MRPLLTLLACLLLASPAFSQSLFVGVGADSIGEGDDDDAELLLSLEYRAIPIFALGRVGFEPIVTGEVDAEGDVFVGAGLLARAPIGNPVTVTLSVAPGYYNEGDGQDLGGPFEIRSQIGLAYRFVSGNEISIAYQHKSNAGIYDENPGVDSVLVSYGFGF